MKHRLSLDASLRPRCKGRIPVAGPWITKKEIDYVADAAANAWYANANVYHERFEHAFADYVGTHYAVALPSCTSAIHLSLLGLGIGPGDEVIVPDITWIATAAPICYVGATPVFADIDRSTWCLSVESFEECITPATRAVIPVDLYGNMPDMDGIRAVANRHGIAVVEDAAQSIGSEYKGRRAGSFGDTGVFSFHGSKTLTTGEGGMLVTDRREVHSRALLLRDHGRTPGDNMFWNVEVAFKYKMSSLQAALGLAQLERVDELVGRKREIYQWYRQRLPGVTLNSEPPDVKNSYWMVTAVLEAVPELDKQRVIPRMSEQLVDCRPLFNPLSSLPAFAGFEQARRARSRNTVSYALSPYGLNLPSGLNLTEDDVDYVCRALENCMKVRKAV
jgi:perosamine synthetase